jgi:hypothetical protein
MRKCGLALIVRTCSAPCISPLVWVQQMVAGKRLAATDDDRFAITLRGSVVSLWENAGLPSLHMQCTLHFSTALIPLLRRYQSGKNTGVSLLSRYVSIPETGLSSKTTPVGCSQDICLYNLTYFSSYASPEYGCIMFPRNLGIRLSVCTVTQHGRL